MYFVNFFFLLRNHIQGCPVLRQIKMSFSSPPEGEVAVTEIFSLRLGWLILHCIGDKKGLMLQEDLCGNLHLWFLKYACACSLLTGVDA